MINNIYGGLLSILWRIAQIIFWEERNKWSCGPGLWEKQERKRRSYGPGVLGSWGKLKRRDEFSRS